VPECAGTNLLDQRYKVTEKHLGLFGLFPDATDATSLCAINMRWRTAAPGIGAATKKNDDHPHKALASKMES
jgi:hypothetical protein